MMSSETFICQKCKKEIQLQNKVMHEIYCEIVQPIPKERIDHIDNYPQNVFQGPPNQKLQNKEPSNQESENEELPNLQPQNKSSIIKDQENILPSNSSIKKIYFHPYDYFKDEQNQVNRNQNHSIDYFQVPQHDNFQSQFNQWNQFNQSDNLLPIRQKLKCEKCGMEFPENELNDHLYVHQIEEEEKAENQRKREQERLDREEAERLQQQDIQENQQILEDNGFNNNINRPISPPIRPPLYENNQMNSMNLPPKVFKTKVTMKQNDDGTSTEIIEEFYSDGTVHRVHITKDIEGIILSQREEKDKRRGNYMSSDFVNNSRPDRPITDMRRDDMRRENMRRELIRRDNLRPPPRVVFPPQNFDVFKEEEELYENQIEGDNDYELFNYHFVDKDEFQEMKNLGSDLMSGVRERNRNMNLFNFNLHSRRGFPISLINQLPEINIDENIKKNQEVKDCAICLNEFKINEKVLMLPCIHIFHKDCITKWLKERVICPICHSKVEG